MAKLIAPLSSAQASGPIGNVTFISNRSRTFVGKRSCEHPGHTATTVNARALFGSAITAWKSLTKAQCDSWRTSDLPYQNPFQNFLRNFILHVHADLTPISEPGTADPDLHTVCPEIYITSPAPHEAIISVQQTCAGTGVMSIFTAQSSLTRSSIDLRKFTYRLSALTESDIFSCLFEPPYKTLAARGTLHDLATGELIWSHVFYLHG